MNQWMRTRTIRMIGVLFGLSILLTACDSEDVLALLDGNAADQAPVAEAAGDEVADDDVAQDAADEGAADEGDEVDGKSEGREFQCRRDGVRKARRAAADDTAADEGDDTPARAADDSADDAPDAGDDGDAAPERANNAPARKKAPEPEEPAPSGGDGGAAASISAIEQNVFDRLNATRREAGLRALTLGAEISRGARQWSCDMAASGNFRHADLRAAGVYGENIAWGQRSAAEVHQGWMNSPGHRDNRMSSRWSEYGVGVCENGSGRLYFTERFR